MLAQHIFDTDSTGKVDLLQISCLAGVKHSFQLKQ